MQPIGHLHGNFLDVLADACAVASVGASDVGAVVTLAKSALRVGSHIDVFCRGRFWEAQIVRVRPGKFRYRFLHTGDRLEGGWVSGCDFLQRWRFPVRDDQDVWKARLVAECGVL